MSFYQLPNLTNQITRKDSFPQEGGAFGTVWRCVLRTESTEIEVAVKTIRTQSNGRRENVRQELIIWMQLHHENIVPLLGVTSGFGPDDSISMVSTWFAQGTLTSFLAQHNTLTRGRRLELLQDIAAGVLYCMDMLARMPFDNLICYFSMIVHTSQVVHGDLSGNNVLINGQGKACLTDFGLSTISGGLKDASYFGQAGRHGAIRWAAPELIVGAGQHSTFKSDSYSFGSIMLQVLSGDVPWSEVAAEHIIIQKLTKGRVPKRPSTVSRTHWAFIRTCWSSSSRDWSRSPSRPSASEIVDFLKNAQDVWHRSDTTLRGTPGSVIRRIAARITRSGFHRAAESRSNSAPTQRGASNQKSDVQNVNEHSVTSSRDVSTNGQSSRARVDLFTQGRANMSTDFDLTKKENILDFEGDLVNQIDRLHQFPVSSGGYGEIWQCQLLSVESEKVQVAVKSIRLPDASQSLIRRRLLRECQIWLMLEHINIVHFYGMTSTFSVLPAMVTAWMHNGTLTEYLARQYPYLKVRDRFCLKNDVASGLCYLHSKHITHGDLTGSSVFIGENGRACLADYGLAFINEFPAMNMTTSTTDTHQGPNSARWAAPELILERSEDSEDNFPSPTTSSDVYSFGCIMLQIMVGRLPYWWVRRGTHVIMERERETLPMRDDPDVPRLHKHHVVFLKRCWELDPRSRPSSAKVAETMADELLAFDKL